MEKIKQGKSLKTIGISLLIVGILLDIVLRILRNSELNEVLFMLSLLQIITLLGGAYLFWRGRQYAAKSDVERVIGDSKPDVLYLRAFETDPSMLGYVFSSFLMPRMMSAVITEEEELSEVLQPFGDLVAIGKPGETLPTPGAARLYVSDAEWKKVVTKQMRSARLVVIRASSSKGLQWEVKKAAQVLNPKKLLILVLNMKKKEYETFRKEAEQIFKCAFPQAGQLRRFGRISGFIRFSAGWKPNFLPLHAPYLQFSAYTPYRSLFKFALRPVFEEYGLEWAPPPVSILAVSSIVVFGGCGLLILLAIAVAFS